MLSFQCQFIVNKFLGSGLFLLFGFLDLWGDPRPGWLDWIGIAAVCTSILLFLWMIVLEKKRGVEKKDEMAVHSQRHAKSDLYDWACIALLLLIVFSQKGIIHPQIGWGYLCFGLLQGLEALLFYYYEKKEDPLD
ncbi:MAG: hypothetical protein PUI40_05700 [Oscillospiraceae bacterium]|nr:hypothetical protein [Oscillospiraceae bacterium]MDD7041440.1 hypothetical protein [Oscillospiraceae bacterium]MDY2611736.1 hypothetical protein [Oscillospiraceae bacterium]